MGFSADNVRGLVLALSSSAFIGTSFIIKKKGLMRAGASGVGAGSISLSLYHIYTCHAQWIQNTHALIRLYVVAMQLNTAGY